MIKIGHFYDAKRSCKALKRKFPDQIDQHAEDYDADTRDWYQKKIDTLSRPVA